MRLVGALGAVTLKCNEIRIGEGRKVVTFPRKQIIFTQEDPADTVFYIQEGKVRLTVVSKIGKEATLGILSQGQFFGEGSLAGQSFFAWGLQPQ